MSKKVNPFMHIQYVALKHLTHPIITVRLNCKDISYRIYMSMNILPTLISFTKKNIFQWIFLSNWVPHSGLYMVNL